MSRYKEHLRIAACGVDELGGFAPTPLAEFGLCAQPNESNNFVFAFDEMVAVLIKRKDSNHSLRRGLGGNVSSPQI